MTKSSSRWQHPSTVRTKSPEVHRLLSVAGVVATREISKWTVMNLNNQVIRFSSLWRFKYGLPSAGCTRSAFSKRHPKAANLLASYFQTSSYNRFKEEGSEASTGEGFLASLKKGPRWHFKDKPRMQTGAYLLYEACSDHIDFNMFFKRFNLQDTFVSWFLLTELHVWMCIVRVVAETKNEALLVRKYILKAMWQDVETRISKLGRITTSLKKEVVRELHQHFLAALFSYDEGLLGNDKILAAALWRNFFSYKCDHPEHLEMMVQYVRMQVAHLDLQTRESILFDGNPHWLPLKELDN